VWSRSRFEVVPKSEPLDNLPQSILAWNSREVPLDDRTREVLGDGRFLSRNYSSSTELPIDFFIAYYPSQRTGSTPHSPQHCLPGAGWVFSASKLVDVPLAAGKTFTTREYLISKGPQRALVFYWYQSHGRAVTSDYWAKFYLFWDAVRMNRTDGALVRILTPMRPGEDVSSARARLTSFAGSVVPTLSHYIPE
jgi:EpsI family protein